MDLKARLEDETFRLYVCNRFLTLGDFDAVAIELGIPAGSFDALFAEHPDVEDTLDELINEVSKKRLRRASAAGAVAALTTLNDKLIGMEDDRSTVSACSTILMYQARQFPNKEAPEKDDIDRMFEALRDEPKADIKTS